MIQLSVLRPRMGALVNIEPWGSALRYRSKFTPELKRAWRSRH